MRFASQPSREETSGCHSKTFRTCHWTWLGLLLCCLQVQAQPPNALAAPLWDGETALSTDDGYAEFSWHMPPGEYAEIYRVTESRASEQQLSFVSGPVLRVYRIEPGWHDFRIQACHRGPEGALECGQSTPKLRLTVTESAAPVPSGTGRPEPIAQSAVAGGPDQMRPGAWVNPDKDGQGWNFYWANRLALPDTHPLFGNAYDLVGLWYTFEAKDVFDDQEVCKCLIPITYRPVVAELKLVKVNATTYSGGIWITRNGQAAQVGSANVIFGANNTSATINWSGTFKNETIPGVSDPVSLLLGNDPASTSNITHYSGNWRHATQSGYFVDDLIGNIAEVLTVTFYDSIGDPVWLQELNTSLVATNANLCLGYLDSGYAPNSTRPPGWADSQTWVHSGCDGSQAGSGTNRNARRYFSGFGTERFWANFSLSGASYASGSVSIGTASNPVYLNKTANLHGIFFSGANACEISTTTPSCTVDLTWFTDSDYPNASAFAYNSSTGARSLIKTSTEPAEVGYPHALSAVGTYQFELRMGSITNSTLIAVSQDFTVTEVSGAPVTPTNLGVVWTDEPNREYRVQWQHPNQASVDSFTVREILPDSSINTYTVTPGTNLSRLFSRPSGPFGEYAYRVRACQGGDCSAYTATVPWVVTEPPNPGAENPWADNENGVLATNLFYPYAMGFHFTPAVNGQITQLGGFFNGTKVVKLFLRNEPELGELRSAVVASSNTWSYASITPISIVAGTEYTVAVYLTGSGGSRRSSISPLPRTYGSIQILGSTYASTSNDPNAVPINTVTNTMYGQVDLSFVPDSVSSQPPMITPIENQQNLEGGSVALQVSASDPDGSVVSFTDNASLPTGLAIDNAGLISGTIAAGAAGGSPWSVTITATDNDGLTDQESFSWTVTAPNQNPTIGNPGTQNGDPNDVINLAIPVSDPDGDQMSCSTSGLPASLGVAIDAANENCVVNGTITAVGGSYPVTVTVNDGHGGTANSSFNWVVSTANPGNPESPPRPAGPPNMEPTVSSSAVGATTGQFRVDESGSATYSIPVLTAPGSRGVAPEISLNYSSRTGNGPLGVGWSLGGMSAITRCSQTLEQDGPTASRGITLSVNDRFCLDGQRLLLVSGTYGAHGAEYRTEIDDISRIKSVGSFGSGPASFTVERKDGSLSEYGNTTDSQIEAGSEVLTWAQNRFQDSAGNYILYHYDAAPNPIEFVIDRIEYTGNANASTLPYARLSFIWASGRADATNAFIGGAELQQTRYLTRIDSQAKKDAASAYSSLRSYFLNYADDGMGRRSLQSVEECNNAGRQACFEATTFGWLNARHGFRSAPSTSNIWTTKSVLYGLQVADVNGDGRPDVLYTEKQGKDFRLKIKTSNGSQGMADWGGSYALPNKEDGLPPRVFGIDLNADGFQDVVYRRHLGNGSYAWAARLSKGSLLGPESTVSISSFTLLNDPEFESKIAVLDFNGDGLSDLVYNKSSTAGDTHDLEVILNSYAPGGSVEFSAPLVISSDFSNNSSSSLFPPMSDGGTFELYNNRPAFYETGSVYSEGPDTPENRVFDYNGDGAADLLLYVWREYRRCISGCLEQPLAPGSSNPSQQATPVYEFAAASFWVMMISNGTNPAAYDYEVVATGRDCNLAFCTNYNHVPAAHEMWPVDINADGLADLAYSDANNNWSYKLNRGTGLGDQQTLISGSLAAKEQDAVRFEDLDGDGFVDLIYPSVYNDNDSNATWKVAYNQFGQSFATPVMTAIKAGNVGGESNKENDASIFADFSGDGKADHLFIDFDSKGKTAASGLYPGFNVTDSSTSTAPSNVIISITNGLGATNSISYKPLTDTSVYSRMSDSGNADWGAGSVVYDFVAPIYVVSQVSGSAPTFSNPSAISRVEYHYVGAKIQAGGRGFLGFGEVITFDPQVGIRTNTRYRQDFPFTGLPADITLALASGVQKFNTVSNTLASTPVSWGSVTASTIAVNPSGTRISYAVNEWNSAVTAGGAVFPFIANCLERNYTLTGAFDRKILTSNVYGSHGNMTSSTIKTYATDGSTAFAIQATSNTYNDNTNNWHLGRLATSSVTRSRAGKPSITRQSSFAYDATTGLLAQEVIEPNANAFKVTTDYLLDGFGNRKQTTVTGYGMSLRDSFATFDALGRFVVQTRNHLGQVTQKVNDWDAFGNVLESENIDGVLTMIAADHMGRPFASYTETGAWSKTLNFTPGSVCPAGTVFRARTTGGGMPTQHQCLDALGRSIRTATDGFDGTKIYVDRYFDISGRPERVSEPYYAGTARYWNLTGYDAIGRPTTLTAAGGDDQIIEYDADPDIACTASNVRVKQTMNGLGQIQVEAMNALGETTDVYDDGCGRVSYGYDATGNLIRVTGADGEVVTMSYDMAGRKTAMSDPDKGNWQYAYNPLGEMIRQRDAKSQGIDFTYDSLGRVTNRRELSGVGSLTDSSYTTVNRETTTYINTTSLSVTGKGQPSLMVYRAGESGTILHRRDYGYDSLGRLDTVSTTIGSGQFAEQTTYDQFGRVFQQFDASGDDRGLRSHYNAFGYLFKLQEAREGTGGTLYQQIEAMDARGNATQVTLGNGVAVFADYEASSGRLSKLSAYSGAVELQNVDYLFDVLGNLRQRHDQSAGTDLREQFDYDDLNRLLSVDLSVNGGAASQTLVLNYDAAGNITFKSDVGAYLYNAAQPHAVSSAGGVSYSYDANGNQISGDGRTISYTVFDKAEVITKGVKQAQFSYGIGNTRYQRQDREGGITQKTTTYLGSVERVDDGGSIHFKRYLGGVAVATYYPSTQAQNLAYLLKDHIGSIHTVLNESAQIMARVHFGAFGGRQDMDWQTPLTASLYAPLNDITTRGFTGHEQVDDVGIIHMNGRIYDAKLGRFLQADPIVQAPKNSQNLNRFSYVLNNPLSYTDPSGFFLKRLFKKWGRVIIAAVASYYTFGWASNLAWGVMPSVTAGVATSGAYVGSAAIGGAVAGFVGGALISGNARGAVKGAFAGALMGGLVGYFGNNYSISRIAADTLAGGFSSLVYGQKFKDGLLFGALVASATYITVRLRAYQARKSAQFPGQIGESAGFRGIPGKLAGERVNEKIWIESGAAELYAQGKPWKEVVERYINKKLADGSLSPLGGLQGGKGQIFGREYKPGGLVDYVLEGYAGVHDSLNQPFFYNLNGTNRQISGVLWRGLGKAVNASNVIFASPIVLPSLVPDYMRHLYFSDEHL